jgi:hypothetical protein
VASAAGCSTANIPGKSSAETVTRAPAEPRILAAGLALHWVEAGGKAVADASEELMRQAFRARAYSVIPKPVSKHVLLYTMLRAIRRLDQEHPIDLAPTFMGAHEVPAEYRDRREAYVAHIAGNFEGGDFNMIEPGVVLLGYTDGRSEQVAARQVRGWLEAEQRIGLGARERRARDLPWRRAQEERHEKTSRRKRAVSSSAHRGFCRRSRTGAARTLGRPAWTPRSRSRRRDTPACRAVCRSAPGETGPDRGQIERPRRRTFAGVVECSGGCRQRSA